MKSTRIVRYAWIAGAFALTLIFTIQTWRDTDVFWHLALGEYILRHGFPHRELFSFLPTQNAWMDQEWGFEVILALLYRIGGLALPSVTFGLLVSGALTLAASTKIRELPLHPAAIACVIAVSSFIGGEFFGVRAQDFTVLSVAVLLMFIRQWERGRTKRILWCIPLVFIWSNLHSGFFVAFVLLGCAMVFCRVGPRARLIALISVCGGGVASLITPSGIRIYGYILSTFGNATLVQFVTEWQSPDFHSLPMQLLALYTILLFSLFVVSPKRPTIFDFVLASGMLLAALDAQRNVTLYLVVTMPMFAGYGTLVWKEYCTTIERVLHGLFRSLERFPAVTAVVLLLVIALPSLSLSASRASAGSEYQTVRDNYPDSAATYVIQHYPGSHVYASDGDAGYLVYRFSKYRMVFLYDEEEVFGSKDLLTYLKVWDLDNGWTGVLKDYDIRVGIVKVSSPQFTAFQLIGWRLDCSDASNGSVVMSAPEGSGPFHVRVLTNVDGLPSCSHVGNPH